MEFPLVSIIVPMYNTAGCIARCVKSICAQTYKSIEILLLNDGSTDDTLAVCRPLAASDHRIALVDKTNTGAADTRNQGIARIMMPSRIVMRRPLFFQNSTKEKL